MKTFHWLFFFIFGLLFSTFTGCYTLKPYGNISEVDYNQRRIVEDAGFVKKRNAIGISLNIGCIAAGGILGYNSGWVYSEGEVKPTVNAAIGALGGYVITYLMDALCGLNESVPLSDPNDWVKKIGNNYRLYGFNESGKRFSIINSDWERNYTIKNLDDATGFNNTFPSSPYSENLLSKSHNVLGKNDLSKLVDLYPNSPQIKGYKLEYLSYCKTIEECAEAKNKFNDINEEADIKAASMVDSWESFDKYNSKFTSSINMDKVICTLIEKNSHQSNKKKADLYENLIAMNRSNNHCIDSVKKELSCLYNTIDVENSSLSQLKEYVSNYPKSSNSPIVRNKILEIEKIKREEEEKEKAEYNLYRIARTDSNACNKYLEKYPNGKYVNSVLAIKKELITKPNEIIKINNNFDSNQTNSKIASYEDYQGFAKNVKDGNFERVKEFVEKGYSLQPPSDFGYTVLVAAVNYLPFRSDIFNYLIENGADVNYINKDRSNTTALSFAINKNNTEAVKLLLENGANPNNEENSKEFRGGLGLLEKAIMSDKDKREIIKLLVNAGANVNNTTSYPERGKFSTLGLSLEVGKDYEIIKMLIEAGANVNGSIVLETGNTSQEGSILDFAETKYPNSSIVTLLKSNGARSILNNQTPKKYITLGDVMNVFSHNSDGSNNSDEDDKVAQSKDDNRNDNTLKKNDPSKEDLKKGNINIPNYKNEEYKAGGNVTLGDFYYSYYTFSDGTTGTLYQDLKTKKYYISVIGVNPDFIYKSLYDAIKALYIYKKYGEITDQGRE